MWDSNTDIIIIYASAALALVWAFLNALSINAIKISNSSEQDEERGRLVQSQEKLDILLEIKDKISDGANAFLFKEYSIMTLFILVFGLIVFAVVDIYGQEHIKFRCYATMSFVVGSFTSILCGYIGMRIAVVSNYRTTFKATESLAEAFRTAYKAGCVMGFTSVGLSLGILLSIMIIYFRLM